MCKCGRAVRHGCVESVFGSKLLILYFLAPSLCYHIFKEQPPSNPTRRGFLPRHPSVCGERHFFLRSQSRVMLRVQVEVTDKHALSAHISACSISKQGCALGRTADHSEICSWGHGFALQVIISVAAPLFSFTKFVEDRCEHQGSMSMQVVSWSVKSAQGMHFTCPFCSGTEKEALS